MARYKIADARGSAIGYTRIPASRRVASAVRGSVQQSVQSADHRGRGHVARLRRSLITSELGHGFHLPSPAPGIVKFRGQQCPRNTIRV